MGAGLRLVGLPPVLLIACSAPTQPGSIFYAGGSTGNRASEALALVAQAPA